MIGWVRNFIIIFIVLTVIYVALSLVSRFKHEIKLAAEYDEQERTVTKEQFISEGMIKYKSSLRSKLLFGIYFVPLIIFGLLKYLAQL